MLQGFSWSYAAQTEADGGREGFVHEPFPTLPFTFCCMAALGLSDMTNHCVCLQQTHSTEEEKVTVRKKKDDALIIVYLSFHCPMFFSFLPVHLLLSSSVIEFGPDERQRLEL